jgi:hypothetical protein
MVKRRAQTRRKRSRRRRTQKGGGVLDRFTYKIEETEPNLWKITVLEGGEIKLTVAYRIIGEGSKKIGYLAFIARPEGVDSMYFPKLGYLGLYKLMEDLESKDVKYLYLVVGALTNKNFYKLYNYYRNIGFYCLLNIYYENNIPEEMNVEEIFTLHKNAPNYLENTKPQINRLNNLTKSEVNNLWLEYTENCGKMIGKVYEIKANLKEKIDKIAANMDEIFPENS